MKEILAKLLVSIALGIITGMIVGGLEKNQIQNYYFSYDGPVTEISADLYENQIAKPEQRIKVFKKSLFNKELAIYYGSIAGASFAVIFMLPVLFKRKA